MKRTRIEVTATENGWMVMREGFGRDSTHRTKDAATRRGVKLARETVMTGKTAHKLDELARVSQELGAASA